MHVVFKNVTKCVSISSVLEVWSIVFMYSIMLKLKVMVLSLLNGTYLIKAVIILEYNHFTEELSTCIRLLEK